MSQNQTIRKIMTGQTKGMLNAYICPDLHTVITKNVDDGFIPERIACPVCKQISTSLSYNVNQNFTPTIEFFMPTLAQQQSAELSMTKEQVISHQAYLKKRGLISREYKPNP